MIALALDRVYRRFGGLLAVKDITLEVEAGERLAILGPNGAGKSTLFNLIAGDIRPSGGTVRLFSRNVTRMAAFRRARAGISRTYQISALFSGLSVSQNLFLGVLGANRGHYDVLRSTQQGIPREARVEEVAERVGLSGRLQVPVSELSHGERRQLELGLVLAGKPKVAMLDEPAAGLAPSERGQLRNLLNHLPEHLTLILVEHDMDVALRVARRVIVLSDGEIVARGTPDEITVNPIVQEIYLGAKS